MAGVCTPLFLNSTTILLLWRRARERERRVLERGEFEVPYEILITHKTRSSSTASSLSSSSVSTMAPPPPPSARRPAGGPSPAVTVPERGGRTRGSSNYTRRETMCMLNTLRAILPIGPEQWEQVVHCHQEKWPAQLRDRDSINRKYSTLHRKPIPTGDPNISPAVKLAKEIKHFIGVKANFGDGDHEFDLEEGYKTNSEDNASTSTPPPLRQPSQTQDTQLTEMSPTPTNPSPTPQLAQYTQLSEYTQLTGATQASTLEPQQSMVTPRQEQRSNKRSYSSRTSSSRSNSSTNNTDFASMFQMSLQQQQAIAQQSFEQSMKQHERTMTDIKDILASLAGAFARPPQKKKKKRKKYEESDSDSDDSSE